MIFPSQIPLKPLNPMIRPPSAFTRSKSASVSSPSSMTPLSRRNLLTTPLRRGVEEEIDGVIHWPEGERIAMFEVVVSRR